MFPFAYVIVNAMGLPLTPFANLLLPLLLAQVSYRLMAAIKTKLDCVQRNKHKFKDSLNSVQPNLYTLLKYSVYLLNWLF